MSLYLGFPLMNPFRSQVPAGFYHPVKGHTGIDINMPSGTPIFMSIALNCVRFEYLSEMGNTLYMEDGQGNILIFAHLERALVSPGDTAPAQSIFAISDNTGSVTTAPHLHFEIIAQSPDEGLDFMTRSLGGYNGYNINPATYLESLEQQIAEQQVIQEAQPIHKDTASKTDNYSEAEHRLEHWAQQAMLWSREHGLTTKNHNPNSPVTWGELTLFSKRLVDYLEKQNPSKAP